MKMLRAMRLRHWTMPLVLAALAARALMPAGFMSTAGPDTVVRIAMCSPDSRRSERLVIPGDPAPAHRGPECKYCGAPILGTPLASVGFDVPAPLEALRTDLEITPSYAPPRRSQSARAPPRV